MAEKDLDKIFHDKLYNHGTAVDSGMWDAIETALNERKAVAPVGFWKRNGRRIIGVAAGVAAAVSVALVLIKPESQPYIHQEDTGYIAILDENSPKPEKQIPNERTVTGSGTAVALAAPSYGLNEGVPGGTGNLLASVCEEAPAVAPEETTETAAPAAVKSENVSNGSDRSETGGYMEDLGFDDIAFDDNAGKGRNSKEYSFSLFSNVAPNNNIAVSSQYLSTMAASGISHSVYEMQSMEIISEAKYSLPLNLGLQAQVKVNRSISVGVGVSYTWLRSRYDGLINKKFHRIKQSLHYIGVPVNLYFTIFEKEKLRFYANAGGAIEKGVRASYKITSYDGTSRETKAKIDGFQYSANAGLGLEYRFSEPVGLYLEPNVVYFFDSNIPASIRTDQPLQIKAEIGFRFHLK